MGVHYTMIHEYTKQYNSDVTPSNKTCFTQNRRNRAVELSYRRVLNPTLLDTGMLSLLLRVCGLPFFRANNLNICQHHALYRAGNHGLGHGGGRTTRKVQRESPSSVCEANFDFRKAHDWRSLKCCPVGQRFKWCPIVRCLRHRDLRRCDLMYTSR